MMAGELNDLYQDIILDHSKNPRNSGYLEGATHSARENNPLCGDRVSVYLTVQNAEITDLTFEARGCAISVASASMMGQMMKGKSVVEAQHLFKQFIALINGSDVAEGVEFKELQSLSGVKQFPTRIKCATLSWHALQHALESGGIESKTS
ncbi:MAG: SUF system NifU family Fe-S cluster assembly protein [Pseudomonadota bacterium]|nr:SUF system NifU family Fe-S cluster assembly protein [Pseudomonadota bacterium]